MSRLGPHVILSSPAALAWAKVAPIVKSIDNVAALQTAPSNAIRVFRHYLPNQNLADPDGTVAAILAALAGYRHPLLMVELWNEAHPTLTSLTRAVQLVHAAGYRCCGASWGTGDYTAADFANARSAGQDALNCHCYWGDQGFTPWHALRYRACWSPGDPPVILSECGRDAIEGGKAGWVASGLTYSQYEAELLAYNAEISKDPYVLGATPFTAGPTSDWVGFTTDPISGGLALALGDAPMPLTIGAGLQKAANLIGPFIEDEVYDLPGTNAEVSRTATPKGWASWTKATNETTVYCVDGRIYADGGDRGDGSLKVIRGPFLA